MLRNSSCQADSHRVIYLEPSAGPSKGDIPLVLRPYGTAGPQGWSAGSRHI